MMAGHTDTRLPDHRSFAPLPGGSRRPSTDAQRSEFSSLNARTVTSNFEGGEITSEGGVTLLGEVDRLYRVRERLAGGFTAYRDAERTEHPLLQLLRQRIYALCCGYQDSHDHDRRRFDTLLAAVSGKDDPQGEVRRREADRGVSLAGKLLATPRLY